MKRSYHSSSALSLAASAVAYLFLVQTIWPSSAHAWNEKTHQNIVDWAFQIAKLVEHESDDTAGKPIVENLGDLAGLIEPEPDCTGECAAQWDIFIAKVAASRAKLAKMPFGPANADPERHFGNITCAPSITGRPIGEVEGPLDGKTPAVGDTNAMFCLINESYEEGGLFDDEVLRSMGNRTLGANLGFLSQAGDARNEDWEIAVDLVAFGVSLISKILTFGNTTNALDPLVDVLETGKNIASLGLGLLLALVFLVVTLGLVDGDDVIKAAFDTAQFLTNIDNEFTSILPLEGVFGGDGGETTFIGLGHFINVQTQITTPLGSTWPSNDYDDHQGAFYDQAFYNAGGDTPGTALLFQDPMDHEIVDKSGFGVFVDPHQSYAVEHYQDGSSTRGFFNDGHFVGDEAYWQDTELHAVAFTPVDNLAFHGWDLFRSNPCKTADALHWPLHALGDASSPMHTIGTTGQGHRPFEDGVERIAGQWEQIRYLAEAEFADAEDDEYESSVERRNRFELQYLQARSILLRAFRWSQETQAYQVTHPGDVPIKQIITEMASDTLTAVKEDAAKIQCARDACRELSFPDTTPGCPQGRNGECPYSQVVYCDGTCTGFLDDPRSAGTTDPTDNHVHCWMAGPNPDGLPICTLAERVALNLSLADYANVPYPAIMAPGLSDAYDGRPGLASNFYAPYVDDHRRFLEIGTAGTLAFLAHAADIVGEPAETCLCAPGWDMCPDTDTCTDLVNDHANCGACGHVCGATQRCEAEVCQATCEAPWLACDGLCVDPRTSEQHCGACDQECVDSHFCHNGFCVRVD